MLELLRIRIHIPILASLAPERHDLLVENLPGTSPVFALAGFAG